MICQRLTHMLEFNTSRCAIYHNSNIILQYYLMHLTQMIYRRDQHQLFRTPSSNTSEQELSRLLKIFNSYDKGQTSYITEENANFTLQQFLGYDVNVNDYAPFIQDYNPKELNILNIIFLIKVVEDGGATDQTYEVPPLALLLLRKMSIFQRALINEGDYDAASKTQKQADKMKNEIRQQLLHLTNIQKHIKENSLQSSFLIKKSNIQNKYEELWNDNLLSARKNIRNIQKEVLNIDQQAEDVVLQSNVFHQTKELVELRRKEEYLVKLKRFQEAAKIKNQADICELKERQEFQKKMRKKAKQVKRALSAKQQNRKNLQIEQLQQRQQQIQRQLYDENLILIKSGFSVLGQLRQKHKIQERYVDILSRANAPFLSTKSKLDPQSSQNNKTSNSNFDFVIQHRQRAQSAHERRKYQQ